MININSSISDNDACQTNDCIATAIRIRDTIDSSVNPCDDFYQFSCGNYKKGLAIPDDGYADILNDLENLIATQLKSVIEDEHVTKESKVFELVSKFYTSCMNVEKIKELGMKQFDEILSKIGGSPMADGVQWNDRAFDWIESIRQIRKIGLPTDYLFDVTIEANIGNSWVRSFVVSL